jgi:hypothetical protein
MQIRPHITILFLLSVFTALLLVTVYPRITGFNEIPITKNFSIKLFTLTDIFGKRTEYADISNILAQNAIAVDSNISISDSVQTEVKSDTSKISADSIKDIVRKLEFPNNDHTILYKFFQSLDSAQISENVVRIIHYGDSQIEGDRITAFLRNRLQKKFGGCGVGLIPARQLYDFKFSILHEASENWYRYTTYGSPDTSRKSKRYGLLAGYNSYTPANLITKSGGSNYKKAWISIEKSPYAYNNTKKFEQCRLFYGHNSDSFNVRLYVNSEVADEGKYAPSNGFKQIQWIFNQSPNDLKIEFESELSPEIYGLALDGLHGVAVDNVAMRGCAGLVFTKIDPVLFGQMAGKLNVRLIILQFGGNIVTDIRKNYDYYERWFYAQLNYLRKNAPLAQIIVIGVADMSIKENDEYVSYPNIELVRDALKKAAFKANAAYWDMYEAMGGKNSMPSWVFAKPPLAGNDFVHFNPKGANIIANMFYNALMYEYSDYKKSTSVTP